MIADERRLMFPFPSIFSETPFKVATVTSSCGWIVQKPKIRISVKITTPNAVTINNRK
jgi:hypothetical protein